MKASLNSRISRFVIVAGVVGIAGFLALLSLSLYNEFQASEARAEVEAENLSRVLEENALTVIRSVDLVLRDVQGQVRPGDMRIPLGSGAPRARELHEMLKQRFAGIPEFGGLNLIDGEGWYHYSAYDHVPDIDVTDRRYFQRLRDDRHAGLMISEALMSRSIGKWALVMARRLENEDGSFAGLAHAVLGLDHFQNFYRSLNVGPHGTLVLRDKDLRLLARFPTGEPFMGKQISGHHGEPFVSRGLKHGVYHARGQVDGIARLYSFRQVGDLPLYVFAGIAEDDYLADWRQHMLYLGTAALVLSLVVLGLVFQSRRGLAEQDRVLAELARSEARLKESQHLAHLGSWELDLLANRLTWSDEIYRMFDIDPANFGASYDAFLNAIHPDDRDMVNRAYTDSVSSRTPYDIVHRLLMPDGSIKFVHERCETHYDAAGTPLRSVGTVQDITDRRRLEVQLGELNRDLERRVDEEVAKNREKDHILIQQSRLAAMGEMIHNIAHQWRQPLNALSVILANIQDDYDYRELTAESLEAATGRARKLLQQMSTTIDDFRDYFRPDREPGEFDVGQSVEDALFVMEASLANNNIRVEKNIPVGIRVYGYSNQLVQVLLNILSNAKEALKQDNTPDARIRIQAMQSGGSAVVLIEDNGGGIAADALPKIFDPYFTTKDQGSGIGLYMSKMIIERNFNGTIDAVNAERGASIRLTLPLAMAEAQP